MKPEPSDLTPDEEALVRALGGAIDPAVRESVRAAFLRSSLGPEKLRSSAETRSLSRIGGRNAERTISPTRPESARSMASSSMSKPLDSAAAELREALTPDGARASFKSGLRASFVAGVLETRSDCEEVAPSVPEGTLEARLPQALKVEPASAKFRETLLEDFVSGELAGERTGDLAPILEHPSSQRLRLLAYVTPLVAAAALALFFLPSLLQMLEPVPEWRVLSGQQARFENGTISAADTPVRLELGETAFMQLQPRAEAELPEPCWEGDDCLDVPVNLDGLSEAILFAGNEDQAVAMQVQTDEAEIELRGSVASVLPCGTGTCIVIGAGSAIVRSHSTGEELMLQAGDRVFVPEMGGIEITRGYVNQVDRSDVRARIMNLQAAQADMAAKVF